MFWNLHCNIRSAICDNNKRLAGVAFIFLIVLFSPHEASAEACCRCTHPNVSAGEFCLRKTSLDCNALGTVNTDLQGATCRLETADALCNKIKNGGICLNNPIDPMAFRLTSVASMRAPKASQTNIIEQTVPVTLNVDIPGAQITRPYADRPAMVSVPFLAQYVAATQKLLFGIALIAAAVMIVFGGFKYILSATAKGIQDGKQIIIDALMGMVIVLGSYIILLNINPNTLNMTPLYLTQVPRWEFEQGYVPDELAGRQTDVVCDACPDLVNESFKGAATRMKESCGKGLETVATAWAKEAIPHGSAYVRGGGGFGKDMKLGGVRTAYIFCGLGGKGLLSEEVLEACGLPDNFEYDGDRTNGHCKGGNTLNMNHPDFVDNPAMQDANEIKRIKEGRSVQYLQTGPCYAALKHLYGQIYVCPLKCNDLYGADCSGSIGSLLSCAGVRRNSNDVMTIRLQAQAMAKSGTFIDYEFPPGKTCKKGAAFINPTECEPPNGAGTEACECTDFPTHGYIDNDPVHFANYVKAHFPAGTTMEIACNGSDIEHHLLYTGGTRIPFEVIEGGGLGGSLDSEGSTVTVKNWYGMDRFTLRGGLRTTPSIVDYFSGVCGSGGVKYLYAVTGF